MSQVDTKSLKEVIDFGYELFNTAKDVLGTKPINLSKLPPHLIPLYEKAIPAIQDLNQVVPAIKDLDEAEAADLIAYVASKGVASDKVQVIIEKSLACAFAAYNLVKAIEA